MDAVQYKCPNCNAELKFDPDTQRLNCEYCMSSFSVEEVQQICQEAENSIPDQEEENNKEEFEEQTALYHCSSCGAEIMAEANQTATFCYYCHNPVILSGKMGGEYKPDKVIGFKITKEEALIKFKNWVAKRWFVPKEFKSGQQIEKMTGLYVPFWTADCKLKADYQGIGKKVRSWTSGNYRYTETKEFSVRRSADITVGGIPADGESKIDDALMEAIEPFDYSEMKPFSMSYLSGFFADKYDVDKQAVFPRIKTRATSAGKFVINSSISGYSSVSAREENYNIMKTDWTYAMLPVWFMTYKYKNKIYEFAINGQTGRLAGTPPLDKGKLRLVSLAVGLAVTAVAFLVGGGKI